MAIFFSIVCNVLPVVVSSEQLVINIENKPDKNQVAYKMTRVYTLATFALPTNDK